MTDEMTDEMIRELCEMVTRDEGGRHFTSWSRYYESLEEMGLIRINRPIHGPTGMDYDSQMWTVEITESGMKIIVEQIR